MTTLAVRHDHRRRRTVTRSPFDSHVAVTPAIAAVLLFGILVACGLLLTRGFPHAAPARWDLHVEQWFARHRTTTLNTLTEAGTFVAETVTVIVVGVVAAFVAWRVTRAALAPLFLGITVGVEKLVYLATSLIVDRARPPVVSVGHTYATKSFPSGHVASAITLYGAIAALLWVYGARRLWRVAATAWTAIAPCIVGFSRMYRGFHYPLDVVAGALLGAVWLTITTQLVLRRSVTTAGPSPPESP
jgi:membrane-associated phospholipid phosphatase